jgi:hypothetical protein
LDILPRGRKLTEGEGGVEPLAVLFLLDLQQRFGSFVAEVPPKAAKFATLGLAKTFLGEVLLITHGLLPENGAVFLYCAFLKGKGLQPGVQDATWERIREAIYQGRGG